MTHDSDDLSKEELKALAEADRLARQLPPKLLLKLLRAARALRERPVSGTMRVDKQHTERGTTYHMAVHGNEMLGDRYDEVE